MSLKPDTVDSFHLNFKEDDDNIYLSYKHLQDNFCLIYAKEKDICMVVKNGQAADIKALTENETKRYKEVLDIAICYHHDRIVEFLN